MKVVILDGYVDEPSNFGVPPYISPYPRYVAGAVCDAGHEWEYVTIDRVRAGHPLAGDLLVLISGPIVPGKYLRSLPISEKEIVRHASAFQGPRVFGGPLARFRYYDESLIKPFDWVALRDLDAAVYDHLMTSEWTHRDKTMEEWDRWALLGADVVRNHPDFPEPLTVELDTSKGCVRYVNKGCSFCIEPMYGKPKFREVAGILAEVRRLAELGAVNFRLGGQADFFSYQAIGLGTSPTPRINVPVIRALLEGIRSAAPDLKVLHTDNGDPAMMLAHPDDAMAAMRDLARLASPGNSLSFGLESADPRVTEANNLNIDADGCLEAVRMVNAVGRERGGSGMPILLPGLNFVAGLDGETRKTFDLNLAFLKHLLEEDLWVRRINIRQVRPVRREFEPTGLYREFRRFKEAVRTTIDHEMLRRVVPEGTVLRDVFLELQDGHVTYGRQIGTYPILVGLPYRTGMDRFVDVRVVSHGQRSLTAVEYPLDVNRAPLAAISALPGIGAKRAARIVRARPFDSLPAFVASLDDPAAGDRVAPFLGLAM
ncbi:MAG: radical SAM protein [Methanobacteriota archaeon]|nr:MAG: radical SAM protein [Euryarchaeota archaeon]